MPVVLKKSGRSTLREYLLVGFFSILIVWLAFLVVGIFRKEEIARHTVKDTEAELSSLQSRHDMLSANLAELATPRGQEASMRQDFGVAKPGEDVIILVPATNTPEQTNPSWWQRTRSWFGL